MHQVNFLDAEFLGNPVRKILASIGIIIIGLLLKRLGAIFLTKQSFKFIFKKFADNKFSDEFVGHLRKPFEQTITLLILYFALNLLQFPEEWGLAHKHQFGLRLIILTIVKIGFFITGTRIVIGINRFCAFAISNREHATMAPELARFVKELIEVLIVIISLFAGLRYIFDVNITALVASLGIGGLAVALAAQDTLANLMGSFIIYLDKPFKTGDLIEFGDTKGTVEHVGFRTTRIRTVDKNLLTVPNKKIVDAILNNLTSTEMRRVNFVISLDYNSKPEELMNIVKEIRETIAAHKETAKDFTVHFTDFESSSLNISVVYFVMGNDFDKMNVVREQINLSIMNIVERNGCSFSVPASGFLLKEKN